MHKNSSKYLTNPGGVYLENQIKAILHCRSLVWQIQFIRSELMRKFAKISAVLAAMVLALAFAGCNSSSDDDDEGNGTSSTKNILAGKTYYSIDFKKAEFTSESANRAKIEVGMFAFDSNGQKVKYTELAYDFKNGAVAKDNIIDSGEFDYSVSGSTLTIKNDGDGEDLICTINSDGSIKDEEGSVMKEFNGNIYAVAEAESNEKRILAKAHIVIVNGASCTYKNRVFKSSDTPQESTGIVNGTVSGNKLTFAFTEDGETFSVSGSLSDKEVVIDTEDDSLILKRM